MSTHHHPADVVVAGHICLDVIPTFEQRETSLDALLVPGKLINIGEAVTATGGPVSNTGLSLHRLGVPTRLTGKVGDDLFGHAILDAFRNLSPTLAEGMIVAEGVQSSYTIVINPPGVDRIFLHCPGANDTFIASDIDYTRLSDVRLFHFGYPPLMRRMFIDGGEELTHIFQKAKAQGVTTSLDMAMPDPDAEVGQADWRGIITKVLPHVDVFLPSLEEILFMLNRERFDQLTAEHGLAGIIARTDADLLRDLADELIDMGAAIVALKMGDQGLYLRTASKDGRLSQMGRASVDPLAWAEVEMIAPCFKTEVVGTTGSGDATIAGFLTGLLKGLTPAEVMTGAVGVGACNVEAADATSGIPTWEKVQRRISAGWERLPLEIDLPGWAWDEAAGVYVAGE